jgi:hypothetical protein
MHQTTRERRAKDSRRLDDEFNGGGGEDEDRNYGLVDMMFRKGAGHSQTRRSSKNVS